MFGGATTIPSRPKVVFVMGAGHSGSTILGIALGNCADFFYAGEVEEWLVNSGLPSWADEPRRRFWQAVAGAVDGADMFGSEAARTIERSSAVLRCDRWRARRRLLPRYRRVTEELLQAISGAAGASHVVDTSHFPLRARELMKLEGIDLYLVFLVRDPHGVVDSNLRELKPHEVAERRLRTVAVNIGLWLTLFLSAVVFLRQRRDRRLFVRHESFVRDPEGVLRQILEMVGSQAPLPDLGALRIGAPLEGNRLIRTDTIALDRRAPKVERSSWLTTVLQAPWEAVLARMRPAAAAGAPGPRPC
ncbi:MAG: sulfotransferase [Solirubrobacteraceae bacterium]